MTWQAVWTRARAAAAAVRARLRLRWLIRVAIGTTAVGFVAIAAEAVLRARIDSPLARMPTALYTRPVEWGDESDRETPIAIGSVRGALPEERVPVSLDDAPNHLIQAVLAVEDQRFYEHHGLDFRRIAGALVANLKAGQIVQGGSTITQQLAKNLFLSAERTPLRKLREAALALVLEARYDKGTILEAYLNEIYFGQDGSRQLHGVGAAARYYFGKEIERISLPESAILAGMIQAPNRFSPDRHEREARKRRSLVLGLMVDQGRIGRKTAERAARARIGTRTYSAPSLDGRYFRDLVRGTLSGSLPARGAAVYTTLDPALQRAAERAVADGLGRIRGRDPQAALVAIDPRNGDILALVGGRDYGQSQFDRATEARRQPGSAFKPIVALAAFHREGDRAPAFTLASRVEDEPLSVATRAGRWEPTNYDGSFRGEVTVRQAIEQSLNVPFARIGLAVGPDRIVATARRLGITSPLHPVPSIALGSSEVSLLELVRAYGVFATGGRLAETRTVLGRSPSGESLEEAAEPRGAQVVDPAEAYLVTSALEGVIERGTGRALGASGRFGRLAGKTGTSNDWRDAWFLAYSPSLVVGVWVGFDDGQSLGLSGADAALPIVARFLDRANADDQWESFEMPDGIEIASVPGGESDWGWGCGLREVFLAGTAPPESDCERLGPPESDESGFERSAERWERRARFVADLIERFRDKIAAARLRAEEEEHWRGRPR